MNKDELRYKRAIRSRWADAGHWSEAYEPGVGSGTGYPDIQMMCPLTKRILPVELKVGTVEGTRVFPKEVRGPQVVWHREFWRAGGTSICMIGVELAKDHWVSVCVPGPLLKDWRDGYDMEEHHVIGELRARHLEVMVDKFLTLGPMSPLALKPESVI